MYTSFPPNPLPNSSRTPFPYFSRWSFPILPEPLFSHSHEPFHHSLHSPPPQVPYSTPLYSTLYPVTINLHGNSYRKPLSATLAGVTHQSISLFFILGSLMWGDGVRSLGILFYISQPIPYRVMMSRNQTVFSFTIFTRFTLNVLVKRDCQTKRAKLPR